MKNIYISVNGDDVGEGIGQAIANDDYEGLSAISGKISGAHQGFSAWIEENGGKIVITSGDEAIFVAPEEIVEEIENARKQYQAQSGHTLSVGIGESMSQAAKALIYCKMNNKNQTIKYDPHVDDYISENVNMEEAGNEDEENHSLNGEEKIQEETGIEENQENQENEENKEGDMLNVKNQNQEAEEGLDEKQPIDPANPAPEMDDAQADLEAVGNEDQALDPNTEPLAEEAQEIDPNLEESAEPMEENIEDPAQEGAEVQQLKADIKTALAVFRDNQQLLEQLRSASPQLHEATIAMMRSMIVMAKKLNFETDESLMDDAQENQMEGQVPPQEEQGIPPKDGKIPPKADAKVDPKAEAKDGKFPPKSDPKAKDGKAPPQNEEVKKKPSANK